MEEAALWGLEDRDGGSMDLVDEVRVMLGAFLCPRVGLLAVDAGRYAWIDVVSNILRNQKSMIAHRWFGNDLDLTRTEEHAIFRFASEILDILNGSVVLANGFAEFDTDPFTRSK